MEFIMKTQPQGDQSHPSDLKNYWQAISNVGEDTDQKATSYIAKQNVN